MTTNENPAGDQHKHDTATHWSFGRFLDYAGRYMVLRQITAGLGHILVRLDPSCGGQLSDLGVALVAIAKAFPTLPNV